MRNKIIYITFVVLAVVFLNTVFSFVIHNSLDTRFLTILFFSILTGLEMLSLLFLFKMNKILTYFFMVCISLFYVANYIYFSIYESVISLSSMLQGKQVFEFYEVIIEILSNNLFMIIVFLIPFIVFMILDNKKVFEFYIEKRKMALLLFCSSLLLRGFLLVIVNLVPALETNYYKSALLNVSSSFGLTEGFRKDVSNMIFGISANIDDEDKKPIEKEKEYNVLEIDFDTLTQNETDKDLIMMYNYFKNQTPTEKNDYTGMFKDKNLIVFVAEAFSEMVIREDVTPNLYRLYNEGFQFENFYTPVFPVSTADGEYITDTGLIPKEGVWSIKEVVGNYMPFVYPNVFEKLGYSSYSFHNHSATYYGRDKYLLSLGYDSYKACRRGLNINCKIWPESDLEMMEASMDDYINDESFVAYYMTVSGHLNYTTVGNMMASRNYHLVKDLPYSHRAKSYLAANIELDKAIGYTLAKLEEAGKLDDTVIVISSDHYPYGLDLNEINELSSYEKDDVFEKHRNALLIWSGSMEVPVVVHKLGSSLDILPTVLNLFGVEYDSRLIMGKDILSNYDPLVIYSNRSFITDKGRYNSITKEYSNEMDLEYINNVKSIINNRYLMSRKIMDYDFYLKIKDELVSK
jgi:lipoteichoic acid synthase